VVEERILGLNVGRIVIASNNSRMTRPTLSQPQFFCAQLHSEIKAKERMLGLNVGHIAIASQYPAKRWK
jgi:hypothetical protein